MAPQTIKNAIADTLENLGKEDLEKFRSRLLDRREPPRVPRSKIEGKSFLVITDVLVSTFCESGALQVTLEILRQIHCSEEASQLESDVESMGQVSEPGFSDDVHFVEKHKVQLIQRVGNIGPILDELLDKEVIQQESYDKIRALATNQDKMRELYCGALRSGLACKEIFYKILEKNEKYLIEDLKRVK